MKRTITTVLALVAALCVCVVFSGCSTSSYTPEKKQQTVKDSALNSSGTLRVGVDASNAPYAAESSGQIVGINVDVAAALADELGLKLELVDVGTNSAKAFTDEDVDIVMGVESENSAYWLSDSYITSAVVLFSTDEKATAPTTTSSAHGTRTAGNTNSAQKRQQRHLHVSMGHLRKPMSPLRVTRTARPTATHQRKPPRKEVIPSE